jgi:hypothetical protein
MHVSYNGFSELNLQVVLLDFFVAGNLLGCLRRYQCTVNFFILQEKVQLEYMIFLGAETTSTTLLWAIRYLTQNPRVQRKVQAEIDSVIGRGRTPSRDDKTKLVLLTAFC